MSEIREIIGNTTATPTPRSDWEQTDPTKADYIKNKPDLNMAVKTGITSNQHTLTDEEKASAAKWLGIPTTYDELKDKPFGVTEGINITMDRSKGSVALKTGTAYFQTEKTYTVDELVGATAVYYDDGSREYRTVSTDTANSNFAKIVDATPDGVTIKVLDQYIFVAYTTNYMPTQAKTPFPNVGVYFSDTGDYWLDALTKEETVKKLDPKFIDTSNISGGKLYKHDVALICGDEMNYTEYARAFLSYVSTSAKPITTLEELNDCPVCSHGYLRYNRAFYYAYDASDGGRAVDHFYIALPRISVDYITAYTVPPTTSFRRYEPTEVVITDTVTEV